MPADHAEAFLERFRKSELFDATTYARHFPRPGDLPPDPRDCATAFVQAGLLTSYQAKQLLQGKHKGFVLGSYKILQPVGKGGAGTVFLAEHTTMRRRVALKVVQFDKAKDKLSLERFRREARSAAALDHPNIVRLFDVGQHGKVHFLAMEFIDGQSLDGLVNRASPLPFTQAVAYVAQAAAGLQHAHERGLVHRDIKPGNLILAKDGTVKVLDLGLARSSDNEADNLTGALGADTETSGTADYVSPEQALNKEVDPRGDVYSLGATLYALIAGAPPFAGTMLQKLAQLQTVEPTPLSSLRPEVPEALDRVVMKMMAKKPSRRYASADEVIQALSPWMPARKRSSQAVAARPEPPPAAPSGRLKAKGEARPARAVILDEPKPRSAWPAAALVAGGALFALLCLGGVSLLFFRSPPPPPREEAATIPPPMLPPVVVALPKPAVPPPPAERPVAPHLAPFPLDKFGTATTRLPLFDDNPRETVLPPGKIQWVGEVPFRLAPAGDPQAKNVLQLNGPGAEQSQAAPSSATLTIDAPVVAFHFLGGVGGRAWPWRAQGGPDLRGKVAMKFRVRYADGAEEEHAWRNGEEVADGARHIDVPNSTLAFVCEKKQQVRYLALRPRRPGRQVKELVLEKGEVPELSNVVFALTVEKGRVFCDLDFGRLSPFSFERGFDGKETRLGGSGAVPLGWSYTHTSAGCRSAFSCEVIDQRPVVGFRRLEGSAGPQFHSITLGTLAAGRRYLLRLEHRAEANFAGLAQVRRKLAEGDNLPHEVKLGPTEGKWQLTELEIIPTDKHPAILVLQDTSRETERNNFQVRLIEITSTDNQ